MGTKIASLSAEFAHEIIVTSETLPTIVGFTFLDQVYVRANPRLPENFDSLTVLGLVGRSRVPGLGVCFP